MGKKKGDKSLLGKKPINSARKVLAKHSERRTSTNPSHIGNKLKRSEMYGKYLQDKAAIKKEKRQQQKEDGIEAIKPAPNTIDSTREFEITQVHPDDVEVIGDEADDEFAPYFLPPPIPTETTPGAASSSDETPAENTTAATSLLVPKVLITTRPNPSKHLFYFIADLQKLIPALHYYPRATYSIDQITQFATARAFTHLLVLSEKAKVCNGLFLSHLGAHSNALPGPTAFFKVSNVVTGKNIPHHGARTAHRPELHLHHFSTRLGQRIGRLLASLFPLQQGPQFEGRQVVTFHNQRDYIFVRQHRYIFDPKHGAPAVHDGTLDTTTAPTAPNAAAASLPVKTRLQELGPRFTLKLRWLQDGVVSDAGGTGEYEFLHKRKEMDTSRRKFHL
jgi:ribosome production factor 1